MSLPYYFVTTEKPRKNWIFRLEEYFKNNKTDQAYIALLKFKSYIFPNKIIDISDEFFEVLKSCSQYSNLYLNIFPEIILIYTNTYHKNNDYEKIQTLINSIIEYEVDYKEVIYYCLKSIIYLASNNQKDIAKELFNPVISHFKIDIKSEKFIEEYVRDKEN